MRNSLFYHLAVIASLFVCEAAFAQFGSFPLWQPADGDTAFMPQFEKIAGSTTAGGDLYFETTTNASKGTYFFSELTTDGFVKTSGGNGALSISASVNLATEVTGTLPVANGGTGQTALDDILGTANQVTVTDGTGTVIGGDVTLSLPQSIDTAAAVQFDAIGIGSSAAAKLYSLRIDEPATASTSNWSILIDGSMAGTQNNYGIDISPTMSMSGSHDFAYGLYIDQTLNLNSESDNDARGIYITDPTIQNPGTLELLVGLQIEEQTGGTTNRAISAAGDSYIQRILVGLSGVKLSDDGDGQLTLLGLGDGNDEDWTINLDDTVNTVVHGTSTGVTLHDWGAIGLSGGLFQPDLLQFTDATELTISGGAITATNSYHDVDTQADDSTDDLDTINGGTAGDVLILRPESGARTVVVKNGTGNITLDSDVSLDDATDTIGLIFDGTNWLQIGGSAQGGGGGAGTGLSYVTVAAEGTLSAERVLTGTMNQITVSDDGADTTVTLSTPQDIATTSSVQFGTITLAGSNGPLTDFTAGDDSASFQMGLWTGGDRFTPADGDEYYFSYEFEDSAGIQEFNRITHEINDVTDTEEDSEIRFSITKAGTLTDNQLVINETGTGVGIVPAFPFHVEKDTGGTFDGTTISALFGDDTAGQGDSIYFIGNIINGGYNSDDDVSALWLNFTGYQGGTTRFRDIKFGDGKNGEVAIVDGSEDHLRMNGAFLIGVAGVQMSDDGDGSLTILGLGNNNDEDLTFDFDNVANTVEVTSSTGVTILDLAAIDLGADSIFLTEKAAADADVAGDGQWWVKTATPNEPYFTDDAGGDHRIAYAAMNEFMLLPEMAWVPSGSTAAVDLGDDQGKILLDAATDESVIWPNRRLSNYQGNTITAEICFSMATATSGTVRWDVSVWAVTPGTDNEDIDADGGSFAAINSATSAAVAATAGRPYTTTVTLSNLDSWANGDIVAIKLTRDADHATLDTAAGDAEVRWVRISEAP